MVEYTLNIRIDPYWVNYYNQYEWQFCFARNSTSSGSPTTMNVIAYAEDVATNVQVKWKDGYAMAAAMTGFSGGSQITVSTDAIPITFGQSFILKDWAHPVVQNDPKAPNNGFLFETTPRSAAVLYQTVQGENRPIYITPEALLPPNATETLIPQLSVAVWFQRDVSSGMMVDIAAQQALTIPMTTTTVNVEYDSHGKWHIVTDAIDYTKGQYARRLKTMAGKQGQNGVIGDQPTQKDFPHKALEYRN